MVLPHSPLCSQLSDPPGVTPKAISHRIAKIKEKANAYKRNNPYAFDPEPTDGSPSKRKKSKAGKGRLHGKGEEELEDDEVELKSEMGVKVEPGLQTFYGYENMQQQQEHVGMGDAAMAMGGGGVGGEGYGQGMGVDPAAEMFAARIGLSKGIGEKSLLKQVQEQQSGYAEQQV